MPKLAIVPDSTYSVAFLNQLVSEHCSSVRPRLDWLWAYYRNPISPPRDGLSKNSTRSAKQCYQAHGLPARFSNMAGHPPREVVIENDIAWRIHALVDFMFGKPLVIQSLAENPVQRSAITCFLRDTFQHNGGAGFFHDLALLGSVHGHIDVLVRPATSTTPIQHTPVELELIEAPRAIPVLSPNDYRQLDAYLIHHSLLTHELQTPPLIDRLRRRSPSASRKVIDRTEVWTAESFETYLNPHTSDQTSPKRLTRTDSSSNPLGRIPVVHIQNLAQPFLYPGISDVEALIPLQDELNTRLSDRANRVTFQSFKMYLGKGIEGFIDRPVGPGQMWSTDNPDAVIQEFGGDAATPSEDQHIREIREAMDKASGVSPIAAGVVGGKTGNLSSENAIRIVLLGLLARIEKKRLTYGNGIEQLCELILHAADVAGTLPNTPEDRRVRLDWPTPFPDSESQQLENALSKKQLGVPVEQLMAELGYDECPPHE
ncbi:MAG: phage portal protein [Planctomycetota bacterium]